MRVCNSAFNLEMFTETFVLEQDHSQSTYYTATKDRRYALRRAFELKLTMSQS